MKTNNEYQTQWVHAGAWFRTLAGIALVATSAASAMATDNRAPEVPDEIVVPSGNKVHFHGFAVGVQMYTWDGSKWGPAVPRATLFDNEGNIVAMHSAGPTWVSNSGSKVVGAFPVTILVHEDSIPWVRLNAVTAQTVGPGIFAGTTYIQRVNTIGGKQPSTNGAFVGQVASVPYTADYFFYRKSND